MEIRLLSPEKKKQKGKWKENGEMNFLFIILVMNIISPRQLWNISIKMLLFLY